MVIVVGTAVAAAAAAAAVQPASDLVNTAALLRAGHSHQRLWSRWLFSVHRRSYTVNCCCPRRGRSFSAEFL